MFKLNNVGRQELWNKWEVFQIIIDNLIKVIDKSLTAINAFWKEFIKLKNFFLKIRLEWSIIRSNLRSIRFCSDNIIIVFLKENHHFLYNRFIYSIFDFLKMVCSKKNIWKKKNWITLFSRKFIWLITYVSIIILILNEQAWWDHPLFFSAINSILRKYPTFSHSFSSFNKFLGTS